MMVNIAQEDQINFLRQSDALLAPAGLQSLTPVQMVVFTLVAMFYIPCAATISVLVREFGRKKALYMTLFEVAFAIILGGVALRLLTLFT
jgi:Fe2+ transport system protein B